LRQRFKIYYALLTQQWKEGKKDADRLTGKRFIYVNAAGDDGVCPERYQ
jgi:hypothetical protein